MKVLKDFPFNNFTTMHRPIIYDGYYYHTVEHFFHAMKNKDVFYRAVIACAETPGAAKGMGQRVRLRDDWKDIREKVMLFALTHKFAEGTAWRKKLDNTEGYSIVEWNSWHDNIWGDCVCADCRKTEGQNILGKLLMRIRDGGPITDEFPKF